MAENRAKPILTETLVKEWQVSAKKGETIVQLADRLGMNKDSLSSRSSSLRRELREQGLTETQVQATMPALARVSTTKRGSKKSFLQSLAERVKAEAKASVEASTQETDATNT